jgi:hypothetical protein
LFVYAIKCGRLGNESSGYMAHLCGRLLSPRHNPYRAAHAVIDRLKSSDGREEVFSIMKNSGQGVDVSATCSAGDHCLSRGNSRDSGQCVMFCTSTARVSVQVRAKIFPAIHAFGTISNLLSTFSGDISAWSWSYDGLSSVPGAD